MHTPLFWEQDSGGKATKTDEVLPVLTELLSSGGILESNRLRLIMIFVITQEGVTDENVTELIKAAKFSREAEAKQAIANLKLMGVTYKSVPVQPSGMMSSAMSKFPFIKGGAELMSGTVAALTKSSAASVRNSLTLSCLRAPEEIAPERTIPLLLSPASLTMLLMNFSTSFLTVRHTININDPSSQVDYDLSRYRPPLQFMMQDALNDKLDPSKYETIGSTTRSSVQAVASAAVGKSEVKKTPTKAGWAQKGGVATGGNPKVRIICSP